MMIYSLLMDSEESNSELASFVCLEKQEIVLFVYLL